MISLRSVLFLALLALAQPGLGQAKEPAKPVGACAQAAQNVEGAINPGRYDNAVYAYSLAGKVIISHADEPAEHAIVERTTKSWGKCVQALTTTKAGTFAFAPVKSGTYYLRVSKKGFRPVMLKVTITPTAPSDLVVSLTPDT